MKANKSPKSFHLSHVNESSSALRASYLRASEPSAATLEQETSPWFAAVAFALGWGKRTRFRGCFRTPAGPGNAYGNRGCAAGSAAERCRRRLETDSQNKRFTATQEKGCRIDRVTRDGTNVTLCTDVDENTQGISVSRFRCRFPFDRDVDGVKMAYQSVAP